MSDVKESFAFEFEEPPKTERKGREPNPIYKNTVNAFLGTGRDWAKVTIPKEKLDKSVAVKPILSFMSGLTNAIKNMKAEHKVKAIVRKDKLYLITKKYSDEQKWTWKVTRKKKK